VRQGCGSKPVDGLVSVCACFGWRTSTLTLTCQLRISPNGGRVSCSEDGGGGVTSPPLFILLVCGFRFGRDILPPRPRRHLGGTSCQPSLFLHPQLFITSMIRFPLHRILGLDDPSRRAASIRETLQMNMSSMSGSNYVNCQR
jgi:hypothetical protein